MLYNSDLTEQNKHDILELFYRTELRIGEKIIDNTDKSIAKELNLEEKKVSYFLYIHLNKKYDKLNKIINNKNN